MPNNSENENHEITNNFPMRGLAVFALVAVFICSSEAKEVLTRMIDKTTLSSKSEEVKKIIPPFPLV